MMNQSAASNKRAKSATGKKRGARIIVVDKKRNFNSIKAMKFVAVIMLIGVLWFSIDDVKMVLSSVSSQKIQHVLVEGNLKYVSNEELVEVVYGFMSKGLITLDLESIKDELENNVWVKKVAIKRQWPDTLILNVTEEVAIAKWGETKLLNQQGGVFSPEVELDYALVLHLPSLSGPENTEKIVMEQYQHINQLLYVEGLKLSHLDLNERHAWTLKLENNIEVKIGTNNVLEKIRRLMGVMDYIVAEEIAEIESIDLRYTNGIAVNRKVFSGEKVVSL